MLARTLQRYTPLQLLLGSLGAIAALCAGVAVWAEEVLVMAVPFALLLVAVTVVDFKKVFYLLLICLPLSMEYYIGSFGTDLPTEPLVVGLMVVYLVWCVRQMRTMSADFIRHPLSILLLLHLAWIGFTTLYSYEVIVSLKYLLAKFWYIVVYFFMAGSILRSRADYRRFFWLIFVPFVAVLCITLVRQAGTQFSFDKVNSVMYPFFRNHVNYAAIMSLFVPFIVFALLRLRRWSWRWWFTLFGLAVFYFGIQYSYTRAAYVSLAMAAGVYVMVRMRLMKIVVSAALVVATVGLVWIVQQNRYLEYAPNYETTISHRNFNNLVEATYKLEDISTMERVYRWVAGYHMIQAEPWTGFGPSTFYRTYRPYTVRSFETYVSDNPEKSGIHSYYLMIWVEQGFIGLLIFMALVAYTFVRGEAIYHRLRDPADRHIAMALLLCLTVIAAFLLINDLLETDKVGAFWFMCMAMLVNLDNKRNEIQAPTIV